MKRLLSLIYLLFVSGLLIPLPTNCQTYFQSSVVNALDTPLKKIMILHLGENYDIRKTVEGEITYWLSKFKFIAAPSNRFFNHSRIPTQENIIKVLEDNNFDGILTTIFVNIESKERFENPQSAYNLSPNSPTFYNILDSYQNKYSTGYVIQETAFVVETKLFEAIDKQNLYEASTETYQTQSMDLAVENFSKSIARDLKKSKLLEKNK
jgi:hypothetical protein